MSTKFKPNFILLVILAFSFLLLLQSCDITGGGGAQPVNNPPNSPKNPFPEDGALNAPIRPILTWECSDPDGDPLVYDIYFGTSQDDLDLLVSNISVNSYELDALDYSTTYYWKVVAKDDSGAETEGPVWSFTTVPAPNLPPVFSTIYPSDGAKGLPLNLILQWHADDPNGDEISYDLYFGTSEDLLTLIKENTKDEFYQFGISGNIDLSYNTTYYWKVVAKDENGAISDTGIMSFTTQLEENQKPTLDYVWPLDGSNLPSYSVTLQWKAEDPNGDPMRYDIYFGTDPNPPLLVSNHRGTTYTISGLLPNRTYYWRIVAKDTRGGITSGYVWSFITPPNEPPNPFSLINPFSPVPVRNVVLRWTQADDPEGDPVRYRVYFGSRHLPPLYRSGLRSEELRISERLEYGKTYYWKVVAVDDKGNERESSVESFTTSGNFPPSITIVSPADGSVVDRTNVVLKWRVSDSNNDRWKVVKVEFGTRKDSLAIIMGESGWFENNSMHEIPLDLLPANTQYFWRVTVRDEGGLEKSTGVLSFRTKDR